MRSTARVAAVAAAAAAKEQAASSAAAAVAAAAASGATLPLTREKAKWEKLGADCLVVGVDEAGRGPLCGPVVAAAFAFLDPSAPLTEGINDSKKIDEPTRERLYEELTSRTDVVWGVGSCDHTEIDRINILQAAMKAMSLAVDDLNAKAAKLPAAKPGGKKRAAGFVYIDGNRVPEGIEAAVRSGAIPGGCEAVIGGDAKVYSIAAASIIAKVTRDRWMLEADKQYPQYGFAGHKGYGVAAHMAAIAKHGPCPIHRRTFAPIKHMVATEGAAAASASASSSSSAAGGSSSSSAAAASSSSSSASDGAHAAAAAGGKRKRAPATSLSSSAASTSAAAVKPPAKRAKAKKA